MRNRLLCLASIGIVLAFLSPGILVSAQSQTGDSPPDRTAIYESPDALMEIMPQSKPAGISLEGLGENHINGVEIGTAWDLFVINVYADQWDLFLYKPAPGESLVRLTNDSAHEIRADLNRQRTRVVFSSDRGGYYEIYSINPDGTGLVQLTNSPYKDPAFNASWSPDGQRIVYQMRYGGQYEIYTMNADGSNPTRLTRHSAYDGMPSWSPDGKQILFVSDRLDGHYYVWVMNADGSNQRALIWCDYSIYPIWSPDGSKIAFTADIKEYAQATPDGWYDFAVFDVLTGEVQVIAYGYYQADVINGNRGADNFVASWSATGRYIGYSRYEYVYENGWLYLNKIANKAYNVSITQYYHRKSPYETLILNLVSDYIQDFDWYSLDADPPATRIDPLPEPAPSPYTLSWSGQDTGGSGVVGYDLMICNEDFSSCSGINDLYPYLETSYSSSANGGSQLQFLIRAIDAAGNVETWKTSNRWKFTIDPYPPVVALHPAPVDAPPGGLLLTWQGWDMGPSGIKNFLIYYRNVGEENWSFAVSEKPMFFLRRVFGTSSNPVHEVRVQAVDNANNVGAFAQFPPIRFYQWEIDGTFHDTRGVPLTGGEVRTNPAAGKVFPVTQDGYYRALLDPLPESITAGWSKTSYQSLPDTIFSMHSPQRQQIYFPPADNQISDWGFEQGNLGSWIPGGSNPPQLTSQYRHTGQQAVQFGAHASPGTAQSFLDLGMYAIGAGMQFLQDGTGSTHAVWYTSGKILHAQKPAGGVWSQPVERAGTEAPPLAVIAPDGRLLVVGFDPVSPGLFALWRETDGAWSAPQTIFRGSASSPMLLSDPTGRIQVIFWKLPQGENRWRFHRIIWQGNDWSQPEILFSGAPIVPEYYALADRQGLLHMLNDQGLPIYPIIYSQETSPGQWSDEVLSNSGEPRGLIEDGAGGIHAFYYHDFYHPPEIEGIGLIAAERKPDGSWEKTCLSSPDLGSILTYRFQRTVRGTLEAIWIQTRTAHKVVASSEYIPGVGWSKPDILAADLDVWEGMLHWNESAGGDHLLYQQQGFGRLRSRSPAGDWGTGVDMLSDGSGARQPIAVFSAVNGKYESYWQNPYQNQVWQLSWDNTSPQDGNSTLAQTVSIPNDMLNPTLSFLYMLSETSEGLTGLKVFVDDGETTHQVFSDERTAGTWRHGWADMSAWRGKTVTITFSLNMIAGAPLPVAYLDEVSLGSAYPDVWVSTDPAAPVTFYGKDLPLDLVYGNRGASAESVRLTFQLPEGVELISVAGNPQRSGSLLTWELGSLSQGSPEQRLRLVLRVSNRVAALDRFDCTAAIATSTPELETPNNTAVLPILIRTYNYLPLIHR
ncbi:MAG: hypothetical protein ROW48_18075 [Bellilinea sp.]|jgi:WD40 repeat protein